MKRALRSVIRGGRREEVVRWGVDTTRRRDYETAIPVSWQVDFFSLGFGVSNRAIQDGTSSYVVIGLALRHRHAVTREETSLLLSAPLPSSPSVPKIGMVQNRSLENGSFPVLLEFFLQSDFIY